MKRTTRSSLPASTQHRVSERGNVYERVQVVDVHRFKGFSCLWHSYCTACDGLDSNGSSKAQAGRCHSQNLTKIRIHHIHQVQSVCTSRATRAHDSSIIYASRRTGRPSSNRHSYSFLRFVHTHWPSKMASRTWASLARHL